MASSASPRRAVAVWLAASRMLQGGSQARGAKRMLLGLLALYVFVLVSPELAVGTALRRVPAVHPGREAVLAAWYLRAPEPHSILRSPEPRRVAAASTSAVPSADPVQLSRPSDPLVRLEHTHLAQYGGDLEALTGMDEIPDARAAAGSE